MRNTDLSPSPAEQLSGVVERVAFHNPDTGFYVLRVTIHDRKEPVTVTANSAGVSPGEYIECQGNWIHNKSYGLQFKAQQLQMLGPTTLKGMEKYLGSGLVKGIGPHLAKQLVDAFKADVFHVIEKNPERLLTLPGIGEKRKEQLVAAWQAHHAIRNIMVFLQSHGFGTARAVRIYKAYGDQAIAKIRENPYRLAGDIHGIGFKIADTFAKELGIPNDALIRAQAGLRHVLKECTKQGHCAMPQAAFIETTAALLDISGDSIQEALAVELAEHNIIAEDDLLFINELYHAECQVAQHLSRLKNTHLNPRWSRLSTQKALDWLATETKRQLSPSQQKAIDQTLHAKVSIITGGPGVGKTTVLRSLLHIVQQQGAAILLCAPTGRAAKRLSETTGLPAKTIHRCLEFDPLQKSFKRTPRNPLQADWVVIDEVSMLDITLMHHLLRAIPNHASLVMVGDIDQLPSIGPGAVLSDTIASGTIPVTRLTEIFRQEKTSDIIINAHRIHQGKMPITTAHPTDFYFIETKDPGETYDKIVHLVAERIPKRFGFHPIRDIQVLTPMNKGHLGTHALNAGLQKKLNGQSEPKIKYLEQVFSPGDKVIQRVNNYDKEVFNGDIGFITRIDLQQKSLTVDYVDKQVDYEVDDLDEISLAYATTVHKSQGSEYPAVVIPLALQHFNLLERHLIYTAVTRGKQLVILVGETKALAISVKKASASTRFTKLAERLKKAALLSLA